jgi:hypothetical protein
VPLTAPLITTAILSAAPGLAGPVWVRTAAGIGSGVQAWLATPGNVNLVGVVTGVTGGGVVTGKLTVVPTPLPVNVAVAGVGLLGPEAQLAAVAIGLGVGQALNGFAAYGGVATGAVGPEVSRVVSANASSLVPLLAGSFESQGLRGPLALKFAAALGPGIAGIVLTGIGTGVATGPGGPFPSVGSSFSSVIT